MNAEKMKLQQVYNTTREQQENNKRYDKRYSKFTRYSLLIFLINIEIHEITLQKIAMTSSLFFFMNKKTKNIKPAFRRWGAGFGSEGWGLLPALPGLNKEFSR